MRLSPGPSEGRYVARWSVAVLASALIVAGVWSAGRPFRDSTPPHSVRKVRQGPAAQATVAAVSRGTSASSTAGAYRLLYTFEPPTARRGSVLRTARNLGSAPVMTSVLGLHGGRAVTDADRTGGTAMRLPAISQEASSPRAVLQVLNATFSDALSPGRRAFSFGATVRLFPHSEGEFAADNGSNLMQRGLYNSPQYKLELDRRVPTCRIQGTLGVVEATVDTALNPPDWYAISCLRRGPVVTVRVVHFRKEGGGPTRREVTTATATGPIGAVTMPNPYAPLAVGGKLSGQGGRVQTTTDEFNGLIDDVFLKIGAGR